MMFEERTNSYSPTIFLDLFLNVPRLRVSRRKLNSITYLFQEKKKLLLVIYSLFGQYSQ